MAIKSRVYSLGFEAVSDACVKTLNELGYTITEREEAYIKAHAGMSIRSWGEKIEVRLTRDDNKVLVSISSSPVLQLFDLGKAEENVLSVFSSLDKRLSR